MNRSKLLIEQGAGEPIPRKILSRLHDLGIVGGVRGYTTKFGNAFTPMQAAFTVWDREGRPICVLYKAPGKNWEPTPHKRA